MSAALLGYFQPSCDSWLFFKKKKSRETRALSSESGVATAHVGEDVNEMFLQQVT